MGYTKPKETTKWSLGLAPLPNHGTSYTVVSHKSVIDNTLTLLKDSGFRVKKEIYRANMNANVAQGVYHITPIQTTDKKIIEERKIKEEENKILAFLQTENSRFLQSNLIKRLPQILCELILQRGR